MDSPTQSENRIPPAVTPDEPRAPIWRRLARSTGRAYSWLDLLNEWKLTSRRPYTSSEPISFPPDPTKLGHTRIQWPVSSPREGFKLFCPDLRVGFERFVPVTQIEIPQPYPGVAIFQVQVHDRTFEVAVDFRDYAEVIQQEALERVAVYFKMQFSHAGYADLGRDSGKLIPGGYVTSSSATYSYIRSLRVHADKSVKPWEVYGRFGLRYSRETRERAIKILQAQNQFRYHGGAGRVRYSRTLTEMCQAQVCIDLPGNGDFCMRLVDYFSIGACVVGPPHRTVFHVPLEQGKHVAHCKSDMSDLVAICSYYLENREAQETLVQNTRLYFDRFLHRDQLAAYYLQQILKVTG